MSPRHWLQRGSSLFLTTAFAILFTNPAYGSSRSCSQLLDPIQAVTLKSLRERNTEHLQRVLKQHPMPGFDYIEKEVLNEQVGEIGPRALQQLIGSNYSFISTPAPSSAMDTAVNLHEEGVSLPLHIDVETHGKRTSTAVYASLPKTLKINDGGFLVGAEYPVVQVHLHGGGTPTATGKNGMSIGLAQANHGIPVLAIDLPGHGRATRQLDGFMSFKEQIDWILKIVDKLVDPRVKVVMSGHSWGGEFTAFWRRLSNEPKYRSRIARFITVSPPIDVSLGGDEQARGEFDAWFERNFTQFENAAAPADFEFMKNSLRNGKTSTVGGLFTNFTYMDYKMPPLTDAQRAELLPEDAFEGESDILTWLGREKQGLKQFGPDLTILKAGLTWKSKDAADPQKTGHNVWDLYKEGTTTPFMYDFMAQRILDLAGPRGMGEDSADAGTKMVNVFARQYANFFLFRTFISHHDEYVTAQTDDRKAIGERKVLVDEYLRLSQDAQAWGRKEADKRVVAAIEKLRKDLGLTDAISAARAQEELKMPAIDEARRAELRTYLDKVDAVDADIKSNGFKDPDWDKDVAAMNAKYKTTLDKEGISKLEDYKPRLDELMKRKKEQLSKADLALRTELSTLHQTYIEKFRAHQARFGRSRDARLAEIPHPAGVPDYKAASRELNADRSETRREALRKFVDQVEKVEADARDEVDGEVKAKIASLKGPEGVTDYASALALKAEIVSLEDFTFCPSDLPEVCELANEIKSLTEQRANLIRGKNAQGQDEESLDTLEARVKKLTQERTQAAKTWDGIWKKGVISSPKIAAYEKEFLAKEAAYRELYLAFEDESRQFLADLKASGRWTAENVIAMTPALKAKRKKYYDAKADFEKFRDQGDALRWSEALTGQLTGTESAVNAAANAARKIWGVSAVNPSADSLVTQVRAAEEKLETKRREESLLVQRLERTQWEYSQKMDEQGRHHKLPFKITRVSIRESLDLPYADLVARLNKDTTLMSAFRSAFDKWTAMLASLRVESQTKDAGNY